MTEPIDAGGVQELIRAARAIGAAQTWVAAAQYIDATISEAEIIGEARAILIIIRDQFMLMATNLPTEDTDHAPSRPRSDSFHETRPDGHAPRRLLVVDGRDQRQRLRPFSRWWPRRDH